MKTRFTFLVVTACLFLNALPLKAAPSVVIEEGKRVKMNYRLMADGKEIDSTAKKPPLEFVLGEPGLLPALQKNVEGLKAGEHKKFTLTPLEGFGEMNPKALVEIPRANFHNAKVEKGMVFSTPGKNGAPMNGIVHEVRKDVVVIDFNHPLAGKTVTFEVEILDVK